MKRWCRRPLGARWLVNVSRCGLAPGAVATRSLAGGSLGRDGAGGGAAGTLPLPCPAAGRHSRGGRPESAAAKFAPWRLPSLPSHSSLSPGRHPVPSRCQAPSCQGGQCPINSSTRRCVRPLPPQAGAEVPGPARVGGGRLSEPRRAAGAPPGGEGVRDSGAAQSRGGAGAAWPGAARVGEPGASAAPAAGASASTRAVWGGH